MKFLLSDCSEVLSLARRVLYTLEGRASYIEVTHEEHYTYVLYIIIPNFIIVAVYGV